MQKYTEERPWGNFEKLTDNELSTVKIINVNPNSKLSLQYHKQRDEFWRVLAGQATIRIAEIDHPATAGDEFFIPRTVLHRISTTNKSVQILEISFGQFDENDIVRVEDEYKRL